MSRAVLSGSHRRWLIAWSLALIGLSCLPYLFAALSCPAHLRFTGFVVNYQDGNTYLAKMQQGARGEWLYHLPFTPEDHQGAFLLTYYILLGQLAALTHLPLIWTYHLARVANGFFLLLMAYHFIARFVQDTEKRRAAFLITALASGLGWLVAPLGYVTADLWVPEGFPFYALFVNPHFPLAMGLMLAVFGLTIRTDNETEESRRPAAVRLGLIAAAAVALAIVQPFCLATIYAVLAAYIGLRLLKERRWPWPEITALAVTVMVSAPFIIYDYYISVANPAFRAWSEQNLTPSPPVWDYALSYGPILILAAVATVGMLRRGEKAPTRRFLFTWIAVNAALLYAPISLQRRLVLGLSFPLSILAADGLQDHILPRFKRKTLVLAVVIGLSTLTYAFLLLGALSTTISHDPRLYLHRDEMAALTWLRDNVAPEAVVLASPQGGLFIPAWAGRRVVYGHPFETIEAETKKARVEAAFGGNDDALLDDYSVSYVLFGPRERALGDWPEQAGWPVAYQNDTVTVFAVR